jgi:hypothetical protein
MPDGRDQQPAKEISTHTKGNFKCTPTQPNRVLDAWRTTGKIIRLRQQDTQRPEKSLEKLPEYDSAEIVGGDE